MKVELENSELGELWSQYAQIRAELAAKIEAEIRTIERRLSILSQERNGDVLQSLQISARCETEAASS